ncbi:hypothetical protein BC831DRAFT_508608 [Entophlyctis helioformis]|nr:hypothetical protein BC831DRAFT_508608 [Entophlyctis helioformis]
MPLPTSAPALLLLMSLLSSAPLLAAAQQQPATAPKAACLPLTGSKACPDLAAYSIMPSEEFKTVEAFDAFIINQKDNTDVFTNAFKQTFGCPKYAGRKLRFEQSTICHFIVTQSKQACPAPPAIDASGKNTTTAVLCKSTCTGYIKSLSDVFSNTTLCDANPSEATATNRRAVMAVNGPTTSYADYCATLTTDDPTICSLGIKSDVMQCGFAVADDAAPYCAANKKDACCVAMAAASSGAGDILAPPNKVSTKAFQPPPEVRQENTSEKRKTFLGGGGGGNRRSSIFTTIRASIIGIKGAKGGKVAADAPPVPKLPGGGNGMQSKIPPPPVAALNMSAGFNGRDSIFAPMSGTTPLSGGVGGGGVGGNYNNDGMSAAVPLTPGLDESCVVAFEDYDRAMEDEIELRVGDVIVVLEEFDDGWALGRNTVTGAQGVFPISITEPYVQGQEIRKSMDGRRSVYNARTKSLLFNNNNNQQQQLLKRDVRRRDSTILEEPLFRRDTLTIVFLFLLILVISLSLSLFLAV